MQFFLHNVSNFFIFKMKKWFVFTIFFQNKKGTNQRLHVSWPLYQFCFTILTAVSLGRRAASYNCDYVYLNIN